MTTYAIIDYTSTTVPTPIVGWISTDEFHSDLISRYPKEALVVCSAEVWDSRCIKNWGVTNGKFVVYPRPSATPDLKTTVAAAAEWIREEAAVAVARGKVFSPEMNAFATLVDNITSGKDVTTKTLPKPPTNLFA